MDVHSLKTSQAPLVSPLQKSMKIEMYNDMYFQLNIVSVNRSIKDEPSNKVDSEKLKLHKNKPKIPSITKLFQESGNNLTLFDKIEPQTKKHLHYEILQ